MMKFGLVTFELGTGSSKDNLLKKKT